MFLLSNNQLQGMNNVFFVYSEALAHETVQDSDEKMWRTEETQTHVVCVCLHVHTSTHEWMHTLSHTHTRAHTHKYIFICLVVWPGVCEWLLFQDICKSTVVQRETRTINQSMEFGLHSPVVQNLRNSHFSVLKSFFTWKRNERPAISHSTRCKALSMLDPDEQRLVALRTIRTVITHGTDNNMQS